MLDRLRRRVRVRTLQSVLESARQLERVSGWLVRRVRDAAELDDARELTAWRYARMPDYLQPWHRESGLFDFEQRAIERFFPAAPAHLLVHGAGGGRETHVLLERGYRVTAAEPVGALVAAARAALGERATVVHAGLEASDCEALRGPFDAVIIGWSAYGHLVDRATRVRVLQSLRRACPRGPVLLSWREGPMPGLRGAAHTVAGGAGRAASESPRAVSHFGLFHAVLDEARLRDEAHEAGYTLAAYGSYGDSGYPHAVLQPNLG
jgi:hypothetical protein